MPVGYELDPESWIGKPLIALSVRHSGGDQPVYCLRERSGIELRATQMVGPSFYTEASSGAAARRASHHNHRAESAVLWHK